LPNSYFEPSDDQILLFHTARSYCAQQVRLMLEEKGIAWHSRYLDLGTAEHFHPAYVRMNPRMVVPTLVDHGVVIRNATWIIRYLDVRFPERPLTPLDPSRRRLMEHWIDLQDEYPVKYLSAGNLPQDLRSRQRASWEARLDALKALMGQHQYDQQLCSLYARKFEEIMQWRAVVTDKHQIAEIDGRMDRMLDELDAQLNSTTFLTGDHYSLADVAWTPVLHRIEECGLADAWIHRKRTNIGTYYERMKQRPSFDSAIVAFLEGRLE
jgi:ganglioside-induced differentiation-associated protein 1